MRLTQMSNLYQHNPDSLVCQTIDEHFPLPQLSLRWKDYQKVGYLPFESKNHNKVRNSQAREIVIYGPTRCGKTRYIEDYIFELCFANPGAGLRIAIVRANAVDHSQSTRTDIKHDLFKYQIGDSRLTGTIDVFGGKEFTEIDVVGNTIVFIGMNNPGKLLGSRWDVVFISQVEQLKKDQYETIVTRMMASGKLIKDNKPYSLMISDANPPREKNHFLKQREKQGKTELIKFGYEDNPYFYFRNKWSQYGIDYKQQQEHRLTGSNYARFHLGEWGENENAVFTLLDEHKLDWLPWRRSPGTPENGYEDKDPLYNDFVDDPTQNPNYYMPPLDKYKVFRLIDFAYGMSYASQEPAASTCLWLAEHRDTQDAVVYQEWRHGSKDTVQMGQEIVALSESKVTKTIADGNENMISTLKRGGIDYVTTAKKGKDSVKIGIDLINDALQRTVNGQDGGLTFYTGLKRGEKDRELEEKGMCMDVLQEIDQYSWHEEKEGELIGCDHGIDPLRYYFLDKNEPDSYLDNLEPILAEINLHGDRQLL